MTTLRYIGDGGFIHGVPARHLNDEDIAAIADWFGVNTEYAIDQLTGSGLYAVHAPGTLDDMRAYDEAQTLDDMRAYEEAHVIEVELEAAAPPEPESGAVTMLDEGAPVYIRDPELALKDYTALDSVEVVEE